MSRCRLLGRLLLKYCHLSNKTNNTQIIGLLQGLNRERLVKSLKLVELQKGIWPSLSSKTCMQTECRI